MQDWRPDWKNERAYEFADKTSDERWAWEFLRRNSDYGQAWNEFQTTGEMASAHDMWAQFGVRELCDPAEQWTLDLCYRLSFEQFFHNEIVTWRHLPERTDSNGALRMTVEEFNQATRPNFPHEVTVKIDLRYSIESQLTSLKMRLSQHRELAEWWYKYKDTEAKVEFSVERVRADTYPKYLRLLDAEVQVSSSSDHDLLVQVSSQFGNEDRIDYAHIGYDADNVRRALLGNLEAARKLRDFGYRTLTHVKSLKEFKPPANSKVVISAAEEAERAAEEAVTQTKKKPQKRT